ncbi:terminase [Amycolatopsis mongoliensis]|uniref:Terminase n=1 Tax=Amycolatopsis mongoliensis TaxID=715475 RepID=A0A9Y2JXI3_9PSEU|nr:terminase [Amycolatopsis sp. 4-36]WIY05454.1 terminase [Amycolatopsis sp. 4-36]
MSAAEVPEAGAVLGSTLPRIWTRPLIEGPPGPCGCGCALTPATSYGFEVEEFARDTLERPLDPWQRWAAIHAGELLPDGRPRFRVLLILVARQQGKTELLVILVLFWLFIEERRLVLGTSTNLDYARESWEKAVELAEGSDALAEDIPVNGVRRANGEQTLRTIYKTRYKIAASNRKGGRSLTIDRLILDELREHHDWTAWNAAVPATNAVPDAQVWAISNQGDHRSVVLDSLRASAMQFIESGEGDRRLGLLEWSAPLGSKPTDVRALAMANPNLGRRTEVDSLLGDALRAEKAGGEELAGFLTEILCVKVPMLDPAVDAGAWADCADPGTLDGVRDRVAAAVDVSLDGKHATLVAAALLPDGRVRIEVVRRWEGPNATQQLRRELPPLVAKMKPRKLGWFPNGPAAAIAADLADRKQGPRAAWPPRGVEVDELRKDGAAICMGFAEMITGHEIAHSDDELLTAHVTSAERARQGDAWRFTRKGAGHCDAAYAAAGAVHLARTLPPPAARPLVVVARPRSE